MDYSDFLNDAKHTLLQMLAVGGCEFVLGLLQRRLQSLDHLDDDVRNRLGGILGLGHTEESDTDQQQCKLHGFGEHVKTSRVESPKCRGK